MDNLVILLSNSAFVRVTLIVIALDIFLRNVASYKRKEVQQLHWN